MVNNNNLMLNNLRNFLGQTAADSANQDVVSQIAHIAEALDGEDEDSVKESISKLFNERESIDFDNRQAAKVWMAAVKFVTPAVSISTCITQDPQINAKITKAILEQSTICAFSNMVDAYSCGASFDETNIFGLYRYALANASSCTSHLVLTHKKILSDYGKYLTAHLCEIATGVVPASLRDLPEQDSKSCYQVDEYRKLLVNYLNSGYEKTIINSEASLMLSILKSLSASYSSHLVKSNSQPNSLVMKRMMKRVIVDQVCEWVERSKRATNGDIIQGGDEATNSMVLQNATNLISNVAMSAINTKLAADPASIYAANTIDNVLSHTDLILRTVLDSTNAYASAFVSAGNGVFNAVVDKALPYSRHAPSMDITTNGWLSMFELPTMIAPFLSKEIDPSQGINTIDLFSSFDSILVKGLKAGTELYKLLGLKEPWALKMICNESITLYGHLARRGLSQRELNLEKVAENAIALTKHALSAGYANLIEENHTISPIENLKTHSLIRVLSFDSILSGIRNSNRNDEILFELQKFIFQKTVELNVNTNPADSADAKIMVFNSLWKCVNQMAWNAVISELTHPSGDLKSGFIHDYLSGGFVRSRIEKNISDNVDVVSEVTIYGTNQLSNIITPREHIEKKDKAVLLERVLSRSAAAALTL